MKNQFLSLTAVVLSIGLITSCGSAEEAPTPALDTVSAAVTTPVEPTEEVIDLEDIDLPTPLQMANILNKAGLEYQDGLTNPTTNSRQYTSFYKRVANFGVYSGDLSYCALNGQSQEALGYLQTINDLADDLGFTNIINSEEMVANFETNIDDKNALNDLIGEMEDNLDQYTDMNETKYILPVLFTGGWLESMFLATQSIKHTDNEKLKIEMIKQMMILDNLILGLKANPEKENIIKGLITDLEGIKTLMVGFGFIKNIEEIESETTITPEELEQLSMKIEAVRNNLVTP